MDADRHNAYYGRVLLNITFHGAVQWILDHKINGRHPGCRDETGNDDIGGESMFSPPTLAWQGHTWTPVARRWRWCGDVMSVNT